ncbi:MAG: methyltransferase [Candidatus Latescibacteria bacterium]|jgi:16S rRNA G1207 methylase RsmC|nr:methyltransferase [Candidatus Latescibacterota bacterium]
MALLTAPTHHHLPMSIELRGHTFDCVTTWGLFHPKGVDAGTRLLLDLIDVSADADCLDVGCGWGPIGLCLTRLAPQGQVHLVDKDFVAIEFANHNLTANGCDNGQAYLSNGLHHVAETTRFDVIVSNIPAKVGGELLQYWMTETHKRLRPGGRLWVVTVAGLKDYIKRVFREEFGNYRKVKQNRTHIVAVAERMADPS